MQDIDKLLYDALSPKEEMSDELKTCVMQRVIDGKEHNMNYKKETVSNRRHLPAAAAVTLAALMVTSVTAFAAHKFMSAKDVAKDLDDEKLAEAFTDDEWNLNDMQSYGGYDISLIGLVSGKDISGHLVTTNGKLINDNTYAVVAIGRSDGSPMPDVSSDEYNNLSFLVSPYIEGYNPACYNVFSLKAGGYSEIVEDGILYRIMQVENIEAFADHTIYLGVSDGTFYNDEAYIFDETTGAITRNDAYEGVNALFTLPIDSSKADAVKAAEIIDNIDNPTDDVEDEEYADKDVVEFMSKLSAENIDSFATPVESTRQIVKPNERGEFSYSYELSDGASGNGVAVVDDVFPDGKVGMSENFGWSTSEDGMNDLIIETYTLNEDGTVTFVIYVPKLD
ncbi:MAG: hypothetical protein IJV15_03630 [Lachnospiraceae bacterium]|nr:hypothetical protein [Lachnospiraceae bacterium]